MARLRDFELPRGVAKRKPHREHRTNTVAYRRAIRRLKTNLTRLRTEQGLTLEQAGLLCGMDYPQFQRIETGKENVTVATLSRIAEAFRVEVSELFSAPKPKPTRKLAKAAKPVK
jgi:hypothetical protein